MRRSTVADVVVDGLKRAGTPRLFGVSGGDASHPLLEAARVGGLPVTLASGDPVACTMAAVTGDLVEAPGAAAIGSSPNLAAVTDAVARALADRAPLIVLTSERSKGALAGKASLIVTAESASHWIAHGARLAATEPRGPVWLGVTPDVALQPALPLATSCRADPLPAPDPGSLDAAARLLAGASRPLLVAGLHCRSAAVAPWIRALAEALPAPMLATYRGKGVLPDPHPLMLGVFGGDADGERLLKRADLVVGLGLDAFELGSAAWPTTAPLLAIGPPQALGEGTATLEVAGELAVILEELAPRLRDRERADWDVAGLDRLKRGLAAGPLGSARALARRAIVRAAREATPAGTIATLDAGPHLADVAAAWQALAPRELVTSSGGTAFAVTAAIAIHLVHSERRIVCFTGTDGVTSAANELETAARLGAPIVVVVFSDDASGAAGLVRLAEGVRVTACVVAGEARFIEAMSRALHARGPSLIAVAPP